MSPEQFEQFQEMIHKVDELYEFMMQKKEQQISLPLDDASRNILGGVAYDGGGSTTKTQIYTDSNSDTHTGPKAYAGTILLLVDGVRYEVPYIATL